MICGVNELLGLVPPTHLREELSFHGRVMRKIFTSFCFHRDPKGLFGVFSVTPVRDLSEPHVTTLIHTQLRLIPLASHVPGLLLILQVVQPAWCVWARESNAHT